MIRISIDHHGQQYTVEANTPDLLRLSFGPMSVQSCLQPVVERLTARISEQIAANSSNPFVVYKTANPA